MTIEKRPRLSSLILILLVVMAPFFVSQKPNAQAQASPDVFFGVYLAYANHPTATAEELIDEVSGYTNLFVGGSWVMSSMGEWLNETFQYAYDKGMYFIGFPPWGNGYPGGNTTLIDWFNYAKDTWGSHLLGFLVPTIDEPAGRQLDGTADRYLSVTNAASYADAARQFENNIGSQLKTMRESKTSILNTTVYPLFTCDYALYQFDYNAGFDTVFAEFGWNSSRQLINALCRGAATTQFKDWGVIITWKYAEPLYIESGQELYNDLITAYDNGAKYITIFDSNEDYNQSILQPEHLAAMQQFWQYIQNNPRKTSPIADRVGFVLPQDYGYGFRGPDDKIWGLWSADDLSLNISTVVGTLLNQYGNKLDIIFEDNVQSGNAYRYSKLIYWNDSSLMQTRPNNQDSQQNSTLPNSNPTSTNSTSEESTSHQNDTKTDSHDNGFPLSTSTMLTIAACVGAAPIVIVAVVLRKRHRNSSGRLPTVQ
jgi:hypothetical protein